MTIHSAMETATDKRSGILRAALELFDERGFSATPMPRIAERAGVAAGTIYRYFESKEALGNAVFQASKLEMQRALAGQGGATPREEFHGLWRGLWDFATKHPAAFRFLETHHHSVYLDATSRALSDAVFAQVADFVRRAQSVDVRLGPADDAVRDGEPGLLIALAFGAFIGMMKEAGEGHFALDESVVAESEQAVWDMLRRPLCDPESHPPSQEQA